MTDSIYSLPGPPSATVLDGDYAFTKAAIMIGGFSRENLTLRNFNMGKDTARTVSFLTELGCGIRLSEDELTIRGGNIQPPEDCMELTYDGGLIPLSMIVGMLAGKNVTCRLRYSPEINTDATDSLICLLNDIGIDVSYMDERMLIFRPGTIFPIERMLASLLPIQKNCLLMIGLSSGSSVTIREDTSTADYLESLIASMGGKISTREARMIWQHDPDDPRKRNRIADLDCAREIRLDSASILSGGVLEIPCDTSSAAALLSLAVLKRFSLELHRLPLTSGFSRFLQHLKSSGIEPIISDRETIDGRTIASVGIMGDQLKGRKISGDPARALIDHVPFLAVMAAAAKGTTIIRDVGEFATGRKQPFGEIAENLERMDVKCGLMEDGLVIEGVKEINGADFGPFVNRDVALAFYMAALAGIGKSTIADFNLIGDHYPGLVATVRSQVRPLPVETGGE